MFAQLVRTHPASSFPPLFPDTEIEACNHHQAGELLRIQPRRNGTDEILHGVAAETIADPSTFQTSGGPSPTSVSPLRP